MTKRAKNGTRKGYCSLGLKIHEAMIKPLYDYIAPWTQQYQKSDHSDMRPEVAIHQSNKNSDS